MHMSRLTLSFTLLLVIFFTACQSSNASNPVSSVTALATPTLDLVTLVPSTETALPPTVTLPEPASIPEPTPEAVNSARPRYVLSVRLNFNWKMIEVQQQVSIPNPTTESISKILLVVQPNWYPGAFQLDSLNWADGSPISDYTLDVIRLTIPLDQPLEPGGVRDLEMAYTLYLPTLDRGDEFGPNPFGFTARQMNLTDWYPFVPPYVDGDWLVHNPWFYGEHLVYPVADFDVEIQMVNSPDNLTIAASALDVGEGGVHRYHLEAGRNFVWSASPDYKVQQEQVGEVTVLGYAFSFDITPGEEAFSTTVQALELYSELFGPYPHPSLTVVEADFEHGMEYQSLYFLSKGFYSTYTGTPDNYLTFIAAHETAHQWWFGLVGNDQAMQPWLDEALCTYSERIFMENFHPEYLADWLYKRIEFYELEGQWVDVDIFSAGGYRPYRDAVYLKGALFLEDLRALIGDEAFFAFLRDYAARMTNELATSADFFAILREHTDADVSTLKAQYFQEP
jgi:hypothetical protein